MNTFLDRQEVRVRRSWGPLFRRLERISLSVLIVFTGFAALYGIYILVFLSTYFSVKDVVITGQWQQLNADQLLTLSGVHQGDNLFILDVGDVHEKLLGNDWVREAAVRRHLPHTVLISVQENEPVAVVVRADGLHYTDAEGRMFRRLADADDRDFPFITGDLAYAGVDDAGEEAEQTRVIQALSIINAFRASEIGQDRGVSEVHFDPVRGYSVITEKGAIEVLFGQTDVEDSIKRFDKVAPEIMVEGRRVRYILANELGRFVVSYGGSHINEDAGV